MATPLPQARVVRAAGHVFVPPPPPRSPRGPIVQQLHTLLGVAIGMWPLTAVVLALVGLLLLAGNQPVRPNPLGACSALASPRATTCSVA
ncbi:MAG: hypothetical protein NT062_26875 [Proteobacteria bacterium]|nr:hypothetical protein [Pseudomonadota bacterium]